MRAGRVLEAGGGEEGRDLLSSLAKDETCDLTTAAEAALRRLEAP
ncbi:MAG TPA: hypothetical protein VMS17_17690 [Gemmataceae bacterium]|nr:hypothetical protein [Gemmataceae bacterium]